MVINDDLKTTIYNSNVKCTDYFFCKNDFFLTFYSFFMSQLRLFMTDVLAVTDDM